MASTYPPTPQTHPESPPAPRGRSVPNSSAHERNGRLPQPDAASPLCPSPFTTGFSSDSSASASRVPCRNSIGTFTSARCFARSLDGFPAGCSGKPKKASPDAGKRRVRLRLRRHAPAKGFSAGDQRQSRAASRGFRDRGAHRGMRDGRRIGPLAALFHVGKLVAQRRDAAFGKARRNRFHRRMPHPRARAMGEDETGARLFRPHHQRRHCAGAADGLSSVPAQRSSACPPRQHERLRPDIVVADDLAPEGHLLGEEIVELGGAA